MKTMKFIIFGLLLSASSIHAQVSVNVNIGTPPPVVVVEKPRVVVASPPEWGPVGYDNVEYYYLPDIQVYYDIRQAQYIYFGNGNWIRSRSLPSYCSHYNLYNGYKVVLTDYHGHAPYTHFKTHKVKYYKGYKGGHQQNRKEFHPQTGPQKHYDHDKGNHGHHEGHGKGKH